MVQSSHSRHISTETFNITVYTRPAHPPSPRSPNQHTSRKARSDPPFKLAMRIVSLSLIFRPPSTESSPTRRRNSEGHTHHPLARDGTLPISRFALSTCSSSLRLVSLPWVGHERVQVTPVRDVDAGVTGSDERVGNGLLVVIIVGL